MRNPWRRRPVPRTRRLLAAAYLGTASGGSDLDVCRDVAYRAARRDSTTLKDVLAVAEDMLLDEANYTIVLSLLEDLQSLVSHGLDTFWTAEQIAGNLGPKCAVLWATLTDFWTSVAAWCAQTGLPLKPSENILGVENERLRILLWTSHRSQPDGDQLGIDHAVQYERAGQEPLPGFSHVAAALAMLEA